MVEWTAVVEVVSMVFNNAVLAYECSMIATVALSHHIRVILAVYLKVILCLSNQIFDNVIDLQWNRLFNFDIAVIFRLAS